MKIGIVGNTARKVTLLPALVRNGKIFISTKCRTELLLLILLFYYCFLRFKLF